VTGFRGLRLSHRWITIQLVIYLYAFAAGLLLWTLIEYAIHGLLSHRLDTRVAQLHAAHHHDPHRVFTIRAWRPLAILWPAAMLIGGWRPATALLTGALAGFVIYETIHYRIHFRVPRLRLERYLRTRHLLHHQRAPQGFFGVTSPLWDLIFGSESHRPTIAESAAMDAVPPLTGPTNLRLLLSFHFSR
jgi:sterol desaturase/sphingolipid hydroxylase (fatty acid hydroxylase superfamily)